MNEEWVAKDKEWIHGKEPKFLYLDIETSPLTMAAWGVYEQDALWHKMGEILMMGYMWGHEKTAHIVSQRQFDGWSPKKSKEKKLVYAIKELLEEADVVIGYNSKKFDIKEINARFMKYDISEPRYYALDPLNMIKRSARFPSHKLEDMAEYFKIGHKMQTGGKYLWKRCMEGDMAAWQHMETYCKNDVVLVKKVFEKLRGWDKSTFNIGFYNRLSLCCTKCGSKDFVKKGWHPLRSGRKQDYWCRSCGHRFLGPLEKENIEPVTSHG